MVSGACCAWKASCRCARFDARPCQFANKTGLHDSDAAYVHGTKRSCRYHHPRELMVALDLVKKQRESPDQRDQAYCCFIESLAAWGILDSLPLDANGTLQVTAPFCHDFFEVGEILVRSKVPETCKAQRIEVKGCDVRPQEFWWPAWEKWTEHHFSGRIALQLRQQDLVKETQGPAGLILAAHPEVTNGGPWIAILRHVLQSRVKGGRCVFATFYRQEAEACVQICSMQQVFAEIRENPFYAGRPSDEARPVRKELSMSRLAAVVQVGTFHRYAVILAPA
eukprot:symbB.v1.2.023066.t1/scaffold2086.1/size90009/3